MRVPPPLTGEVSRKTLPTQNSRLNLAAGLVRDAPIVGEKVRGLNQGSIQRSRILSEKGALK